MSSRDTTQHEWQPGDSFQGSTSGSRWEPPSTGGSAIGDQSSMDRAKETAGMAQEKAGHMADQATAKADAGMEKAASGLDTASQKLRERGESMGGGAAGAATMAAEKFDVASQYLHGKDTDQLMTDLESLVRRKPVESLAVAAGIGFLLSKVMR